MLFFVISRKKATNNCHCSIIVHTMVINHGKIPRLQNNGVHKKKMSTIKQTQPENNNLLPVPGIQYYDLRTVQQSGRSGSRPAV